MAKRKTIIILRILFILVVLLIFFLVKYYNCILLDLAPIPEKIKINKKIFFLYGSGLCSTCPPGKYLISLKNKEDILYVVPEEYSDTDILNLKDIFMLKGDIIRGDRNVIEFLKKIAACNKFADWRNNIYMEIKNNKSISKLGKI